MRTNLNFNYLLKYFIMRKNFNFKMFRHLIFTKNIPNFEILVEMS